MFYNKDQLTNYMVQGHVHLSKKDYGFFNNIKYQIQQNKPITSNQNKLFDKLLLKYKRQLSKLGHDSVSLQELFWKHSVVDTQPEYLEAKISLIGNKIVIQSPFNTQFISTFRKKAHDIFTWDKVERAYIGEGSTYSLKLAVHYVTEFYDSVRYCPKVVNLLEQLKPYEECKYWKPTLVKIQNNFYIVASNSVVMDAISNVELNDNPKTLLLLSQYGIKIDETVLTTDFSRFAADFFTTFDLDKLDKLSEYLKTLEIDTVILARDIIYNKKISAEIRNIFENSNLICTSSLEDAKGKSVILHYNRLIDNYEGTKRTVCKFITLTNSRPIAIK